jgi:hypothetical protein
MLSKLEYYTRNSCGYYTLDASLEIAIKEHLRRYGHELDIIRVSGGTLGETRIAILDGKECFLKTHRPDANCRKRLSLEVNILDRLYGREIGLDWFVLDDGRIVMTMDRMQPLEKKPEIEEIQKLIMDYSEKLKDFSIPEGIAGFEDLLCYADRGLAVLKERELLSSSLAERLKDSVGAVRAELYKKRAVLCHGDLSNVNLMVKEGRVVVLDWEDTFMGIEGYDLIYWLTFFDQRRFYNRDAFHAAGLLSSINGDLMKTIVLLKCYLSFINESWKKNKVRFEDRILEIISLFA